MQQALKPASDTCWIGCLLDIAQHLVEQNANSQGNSEQKKNGFQNYNDRKKENKIKTKQSHPHIRQEMVRNDFNETIGITIIKRMEKKNTKRTKHNETEIERVEKSEKSKWLILIVAENYRIS